MPDPALTAPLCTGRSGRRCFVVTELLRGGELLEALLERGAYSERDARTIFGTVRAQLPCSPAAQPAVLTLRSRRAQILAGVAYLHARRITHRDLKLENLLLGDKSNLGSVCICDFGLAHTARPEDAGVMSLVCGTPMYVAPEIVTGKRYGNGVDLWSCGVVLFILLAGVVPFDEDPNDEQAIYRRIARGAYSLKSAEWQAVSTEAKALVAGLLTVNPLQRLNAEAALTHPWLSNADMPAEAVLPGAATGLLAFAARLRAPAVRVYPPGAYLIRQGDPATEMLILRSGTCNVLVQDDDPLAPPRTVATRQPPDFLGEMGILMDRSGKIVVPGLSGHIETHSVGTMDSALQDLQLREHADDDDDDPVVGRRTASVVAVTEVEAAVLHAREVRWALQHDESVRREIVTAVEQRQKELLSRR